MGNDTTPINSEYGTANNEVAKETREQPNLRPEPAKRPTVSRPLARARIWERRRPLASSRRHKTSASVVLEDGPERGMGEEEFPGMVVWKGAGSCWRWPLEVGHRKGSCLWGGRAWEVIFVGCQKKVKVVYDDGRDRHVEGKVVLDGGRNFGSSRRWPWDGVEGVADHFHR